jgi:hypothetical protein
MILDRNINANGRGKYALILVRTLDGYRKENPVWDAIKLLEKEGIIRWGNESPDKRFFVLGYGDQVYGVQLKEYARRLNLRQTFADRNRRQESFPARVRSTDSTKPI